MVKQKGYKRYRNQIMYGFKLKFYSTYPSGSKQPLGG